MAADLGSTASLVVGLRPWGCVHRIVGFVAVVTHLVFAGSSPTTSRVVSNRPAGARCMEVLVGSPVVGSWIGLTLR